MYDDDDIKKLKQKSVTFCFDKEAREQCDGGPCKFLRKKEDFWQHHEEKLQKIWSAKTETLSSPIRHWKKFTPVGKQWVLSHRCHKKLCVNIKHIECDRNSMNSSRNGCKTLLSKIKKHKNQTLRCSKHKPCCFM